MRRQFVIVARPQQLEADPAPLFEALADALDQLASVAEGMPETWADSREGLEVRATLNRGFEVIAGAAGLHALEIQQGLPLAH
ncbi:MAG: hypothetical protein JO127_09870 [Caulobacteraceae bacterium]|nr:hypothetical protein [Caulobacteraceae bacterium]